MINIKHTHSTEVYVCAQCFYRITLAVQKQWPECMVLRETSVKHKKT